jgi:UDP-3-O-[3-hydroxymyristoyl] glucosamine N-acyltransferase
MKFSHPIRLEELCQSLDCRFAGNPDLLVTGLNEIHVVQPGEVTFVDHPKYYQKALKSPASIVIIDKEVPCPEGKGLIFSDNPFSVFKTLINRQLKFSPATGFIAESAKIGANTVIQPGAFIGENVVIGDHCLIHSNVSIYQDTVIGNHVIIHANTILGADAFYVKRRPDHYEKFPSCGRVVIHDHVEIGAGCTIDRGVTSDTIIGEGTKMDNQVHIGHDTRIGKHCLIAAQVGISGVVTLEDYVIIWGQVGVSKDLVIGKGAVVLPKSGVMRSLEGGKSYLGAPCEETKTAMRQWIGIRKLPEILRKLKI